MIRLEDELKSALRREEPSVDFAAQVLARVEQSQRQRQAVRASWKDKIGTIFAWPRLGWTVATAAMVVVLVTGGLQYRSYQRRHAEGEQAKEQVMLAFHIASAKLNVARKKVQENSERQTDSNTGRGQR